MIDIESEITGKTVEQNLLESNVPPEGIIINPSDRKTINGETGQALYSVQEAEYEKLKKAEVKTNWLRQEGTLNFMDELRNIRETKLIEAENLAKMGQSEASIRLLLKCAALRETIEIIREI